jgi:hypothetical protein
MMELFWTEVSVCCSRDMTRDRETEFLRTRDNDGNDLKSYVEVTRADI